MQLQCCPIGLGASRVIEWKRACPLNAQESQTLNTDRFAVEKWKPLYLQSTCKGNGKLLLKTRAPWWLLIRVFKGKDWGFRGLGEQDDVQKPWVESFGAIYGKMGRGFSTNPPAQRTLRFGKGSGVQLGSMRGQNVGSGCCWRSEFSPLHMLWLHDLWFLSVVSEKQFSILLETG